MAPSGTPVSPELQAAVAAAHAAHPGIGSKALVKHLRNHGWEVDNKTVKAAIDAVLALTLALYNAEPEQTTESEPGEMHECTYCGLECGECGKCGKCAELLVAVPARYCSTECQEAHWPVHKTWHRKLKGIAKLSDAARAKTIALTTSAAHAARTTTAGVRLAAAPSLSMRVTLAKPASEGYSTLPHGTTRCDCAVARTPNKQVTDRVHMWLANLALTTCS